MFQTIASLIPRDQDLPERARVLDIRKRILAGTFYDSLPYEFHDERTPAGDYIPLRQRRPSVRYGLSRMIVEDSVSLLFSEGHFPSFDSTDPFIRTMLAALVRETKLNAVMIEAAIRGSIGSAAILLKILNGRVFFTLLDTSYLTPEWDPEEPDRLYRVTERYKVSGRTLQSKGYDKADPSQSYWFERVWDTAREIWYQPYAVGEKASPQIDFSKTIEHKLGFVPIAWIRNLPGGESPDGSCTFSAAIDTSIEIDYQLSQAGRGLKYSSDPTLLIKEPAGIESAILKNAGNALVLSESGDARLLEIGGTASAAVIEYVRILREYALESTHGNRASADRIAAAQSGRALELMNQNLIWLADNLRISYGECGLLELARMVLRAASVYQLRVEGQSLPKIESRTQIWLVWPRWYEPSSDDRHLEAQTLAELTKAGLMSRQTAVRSVAKTYDVVDAVSEISRIEQEAGEK
jgi:hypothetical protein